MFSILALLFKVCHGFCIRVIYLYILFLNNLGSNNKYINICFSLQKKMPGKFNKLIVRRQPFGIRKLNKINLISIVILINEIDN